MLPRHALAALVMAVLPALACAAPAAAEGKDPETSPAEKARRQLDQTVTLELADQSLSAALNQLREQTKLNFVVDKSTMQQFGLDPEQVLVNVKLKDVKARTALRSLLAPHNLGYAIVGDTVLVSTEDAAMTRQLKQRVSLDVDKMDLAAALKKLSKETAANVVLDSRVSAKLGQTEVTVQLDDVPLENAVRLVAESAGLKPVKVGNVLMVTTKAIAAEMRKDAEPQPQVKNYGMVEGDFIMMNAGNFRIWKQGGVIMRVAPGGINPGDGQIMPQGTAVPPLDKPPDKDAPIDDPAPEKEKKN
jgi:type II secretory pathway component GspD/PulD (secretin)